MAFFDLKLDECAINQLELLNCTEPSFNKYPFHTFLKENDNLGLTFLEILISFYGFLAMSLLCETYFVPSVELIIEELSVDDDIVGASFMAITTSAPELFVNIIGTFVSKDNIGVGTIIGSAVFNIFVVSACISFAIGVVDLKCWAITRDSFMYVLSILGFCLVILDDIVTVYEATFLILLYGVYILMLIFDRRLKTLFFNCMNSFKCFKTKLEIQPSIGIEPIGKEINEHLLYPLRYPKGNSIKSKIWWILCLPIILIFFLTIPNCNKNRKCYILTFILSAVHLAVQSYLVSWCFSLIGYHFRIPISAMGFIFLAIGTSLPELVSSIYLAKKGFGGMSISNAIGSNTFDILLCLGVPWLLTATVFRDCPNDYMEFVHTIGFVYMTAFLLIGIAIFYLVLVFNKFKLIIIHGILFAVMYALFTAISMCIELNVFFTTYDYCEGGNI